MVLPLSSQKLLITGSSPAPGSPFPLQQEDLMLTISPEALARIEELHQAQGGERSAIRIAVMGGGRHGSGLGLIVDERSDDDLVFDEFSVPIIAARNLMDYCRRISIDFRTGGDGRCGGVTGNGFLIVAENPINL
jgi:Fe-S cluster assembly iron-binding protein IscA